MNAVFRLSLVLVLLSLFGCGGDDTTAVFPSVRTWGHAVLVSGEQDAYGAQSAMDGKGNALVAWISDSYLYSRKYSASGGWDAAAARIDNAVLRVSAYSLAMNVNGDAVAAWRAEETTGDFFSARRFAMSAGWDADFQLLSDNNFDGQVPSAAINAAGSIMTVFSKYNANELYARGYAPGTGWDAAPTVIDSAAYVTNYPQVAMDDNGNGVAVWERYDGTYTNAYARHYTAGAGWDATVTTLDDPAVIGHVGSTHIVLNAQGSGVAFWEQPNGASYGAYARRFSAGPLPGWDTEIFPVVSSANPVYDLRGAVDPNGNMVITWIVQDGARSRMFARAYHPANGWDASATAVSDTLPDLDVKAAFFALDKNGNGLAVWSQDNETNPAIYARDYSARFGWSRRIQKVYQYPAGFGGEVTSLSLTPKGKALVVFSYVDVPGYASTKLMAILSR
jgi:hypothetical protein